MSDCIQVLTTAGLEDEAAAIAAALLDARLAACVQTVGPITSAYVWQGERELTIEWQCLAKTEERHRLPRLPRLVGANVRPAG